MEIITDDDDDDDDDDDENGLKKKTHEPNARTFRVLPVLPEKLRRRIPLEFNGRCPDTTNGKTKNTKWCPRTALLRLR